MNIASVLTEGLEAISFQKDRLLFIELTSILKAFDPKQLASDEKTFAEFALAAAKATSDHTNMNIRYILDRSRMVNAWVYYPKMDKNHPLNAYLEEAKNHPTFNIDARTLVKNKVFDLGWVDNKTATVGGIYSKVAIDVHLTRGLLRDEKMTVEEKVAVIIHELGHAYTFFEMIGVSVTTNFAMVSIMDTLLGTDDRQRRVQFLKDLTSEGFLKGADAEEAGQIDKPEVLLAVLLDARLKAMRSQTGSCIYDMIGAEFLADQFAARQGAGKHIVTALNKMHGSWNMDAAGGFKRLIVNVASIAGIILLSSMTSGAWAVIVILTGCLSCPIASAYDTPSDRFKRVRGDLVNALKDDIDDEYRKTIVEEIEEIDRIVGDSKPFIGIIDWFFVNVIPKHKRELKAKELQQQLERIANNDLFVKAAKLQLLA